MDNDTQGGINQDGSDSKGGIGKGIAVDRDGI